MDNIISFPNELNTESSNDDGFGIPKFNSMFGFLKFIKTQLEDEDYKDVLCGILDPDIYDELDDELKEIVRAFLNKCTFVQDFT